jgi:hypothetical protein
MATQFKTRLKVGQRVTFFRTHDKAVQFTGKITRIYPGDEDCVDIKTEAGNGSVSRLETAHAADVTVIEEAPKDKASKGNAPAAADDAAEKSATE